MRQLARFTLAIGVLAISGCATTDVGSFVDRAIDFRQYRTYDWAPAVPHADEDSRLQKNVSFHDRLQGEIERQLGTKGFRGPTSRNPDVLVRYRTAVTQRLDVNQMASGYGYCSNDCPGRIADSETATFVVDIVDARTKKVIWRGWAQDDLADVLSTRMARKIHDAITQMMTNFPSNS